VPTLKIQNLVADYVHTKPATSPTKELSKKADKVIREHSNEPTLELDINDVEISDSELGIVNKASEPQYRLFVSGAQVKIQNLSNHAEEGVATITATGRFMNSGKTRLVARLRPKAKSPNFDLQLAVEQAELKALNPLLKAYIGADVVAGQFSFYSEIAVRNGVVDGYVKPLFKDVDVYDPKQDRKKGIFAKLYEGILGGLAWVLENRPREEVATTTKISGKLSDPETSLADIIIGLVQNAFFRAVLPGLEREIEVGRKRR
jgi:Domain of Unknown Function (DUF748)